MLHLVESRTVRRKNEARIDSFGKSLDSFVDGGTEAEIRE